MLFIFDLYSMLLVLSITSEVALSRSTYLYSSLNKATCLIKLTLNFLQLGCPFCHFHCRAVCSSFDPIPGCIAMVLFRKKCCNSWPFQDARKGVLFIDFPPVLQLQLKRFEYDFMRDTMVKVSVDPERLSDLCVLNQFEELFDLLLQLFELGL